MRICSLTVPGCCQPPAPRPGGQGTASRSVSPGGCPRQWHCQGLPLPPAHRSARQQVGRVSLHPARRPTETFTSPVIACTQLQAANTSNTGPTDADRSVSMGCWGACQGCQGVGGCLLPLSHRAGGGLGCQHPLPTCSLSCRRAVATPRHPRWPHRAALPPPCQPAPAPPVASPAAPARSRCSAFWVSGWRARLGVPWLGLCRREGPGRSPVPCLRQGPAPASGTHRAGCCTATPTSPTCGGSASPRRASATASAPTTSVSPCPCSLPVARSPSLRYPRRGAVVSTTPAGAMRVIPWLSPAALQAWPSP